MRSVYHQALNKFGPENQAWKAVEEFGELTAALGQFREGRVGIDKLAEEIADSFVMLEQLRIFANEVARKNIVEEIKQQKIERLERQIRGEE